MDKVFSKKKGKKMVTPLSNLGDTTPISKILPRGSRVRET